MINNYSKQAERVTQLIDLYQLGLEALALQLELGGLRVFLLHLLFGAGVHLEVDLTHGLEDAALNEVDRGCLIVLLQ